MKSTTAHQLREKQRTLDLIEAIEAQAESINTGYEATTIRSGKIMFRLAPKAGRAQEVIKALKAIKKPVAKRVTRRYPAFDPCMSTAFYVKLFYSSNAAISVANPDGAIADFFQPLNESPCSLYENGALDFDAIEEPNDDRTEHDHHATQAVAALVATAQAQAAIEQASEAAAQADDAHADQVQELCTAGADELATTASTDAPNAPTCSADCTARPPVGESVRLAAHATGSNVNSKSGNWSARLKTTPDGRPMMEFSTAASGWTAHHFDNAHDRMAALQAMARRADGLTPTTDNTQAVATTCSADRAITLPVGESTRQEPSFTPTGPVAVDLGKLLAGGLSLADLIGLGVEYSGDMANPSGSGAIVSAEPCKWYTAKLWVQLEDGREISTSPHDYHDAPGCRFKLNFKRHGVPYLAQLTAAVASKKANTSAAKEQAANAHTQGLIDMAAQFPQLKRADSTHSGGKMAAINARILLKEAFKGVKFSVTSSYSSLDIRWTGGPTSAAVDAVIGRFDIGAADYHTDYFYTINTAFSQLFGGAQYVNTHRTASESEIGEALLAIYGENGPTVADYQNQNPWDKVQHGCKGYRADSYNQDAWYWLAQVRRVINGEK